MTSRSITAQFYITKRNKPIHLHIRGNYYDLTLKRGLVEVSITVYIRNAPNITIHHVPTSCLNRFIRELEPCIVTRAGEVYHHGFIPKSRGIGCK